MGRKAWWDVSDLKMLHLAKSSCLFQLYEMLVKVSKSEHSGCKTHWNFMLFDLAGLTKSFWKTDCQTSSTTIYVIDNWYHKLEIRSSSQKPPSRLNQKKKELERFFKLHFDHHAIRIFFFHLKCWEKKKKLIQIHATHSRH